MKIIIADLNEEIINSCNSIGINYPLFSTYLGSIFQVDADAIVSPANSFGFMDGGIDLALSRYFGITIQTKLQDVIKEKHHGELLVGQAEIIETYHPKFPYLISAPTMRVPMILNESVNIYLAIRATLLLIKYGTIHNIKISDTIKTVVFPGMGTGIGRIPPEIFAKQLKTAINDVLVSPVFPESWWDASKRHQLLYQNKFNDLQYE